jgi:VLRF1 release factor-like protein
VTPSRPAAGGGRWVEVEPARLPRWLDGFAQRHGRPTWAGLVASARDGARAELHPPPGVAVSTVDELLASAAPPIGLLLARQGAVAVGLATNDRLTVSKVDSSYVQGRTAAGGWSQQRFARRRVNQAKAAAGSAADIVARILVPAVGRLAAVVTGGDRRTVDTILADPRLAPVAALRSERFLDVGEPRLATLEQALVRARAVVILVRDPPAAYCQ